MIINLTLNTYGILFFYGGGFSTNISLLWSEYRKSDSVRSQMFVEKVSPKGLELPWEFNG